MATGPGKQNAEQIEAVQLLRGLAAMLVVFGHSQSAMARLALAHHQVLRRLTILPWGAGVDLFFVISGFIMVYTSQRLFGAKGAWRAFMRRRIVRIAPLYWVCTTAYLGLLFMAAMKGDPLGFDWPAVAASYLFFPHQTPDGVFPVFELGWTLNYEMFFYVLFACTLGFRRRMAIVALSAQLLFLVVAGLSAPSAGQAAFKFWTQPIILDFGLGVLVAEARCAGVRWSWTLRGLLAVAAAVAFALDPLKLFSGDLNATTANGLARVLTSGAPAALLLAAAVLGPDLRTRRLVPLLLLGDASYSLYLTHPFALILIEKLATKTAIVDHVGYWPLVGAAVLSAAIMALASYKLLEQPLTRFAGRLTKGVVKAPSNGAAPARSPTLTGDLQPEVIK